MAGGSVTIKLGWPPRQLSPNGRVHHFDRARFKKAAKATAYWLTKEQLGATAFEHDGGDIAVRILAHPKTKTRPDDDNLIASLKAPLDGIAFALGVDDKHFRPSLEWGDPVKDGCVLVTIV